MTKIFKGVWVAFWLLMLLAISVYAGSDKKVNQDANTSVQNEPSITINHHYAPDPLNIVVGYNDIGTSLGISYSPDSGKAWFDVQLPLVYTLGTGDPSVASDLNGNVYAAFLTYEGPAFYGKSGIFVCKSTDGGRNWNTPYPVDNLIYTSTPVPFADKCMMTVDTNSGSPYANNIYVAWQRDNTDGAHSDIYFAYSNNGGTSYSTPIKINDNPLGTAFCEGAFPFVGADGDVYVTWYDSYFQGHEPGSLYVDKSTNGGVSFGADVKVSNFLAPPKYTHSNSGFKAKSFPCGAADPFFADSLYITYIGDPDGYFDRRVSNGKVPGVPPGGGSPSDWPVVERNGNNVYVAYRDNRNGGSTDLYFNRSTDNGVTWETPDIGPLDNGDTPGANNSWLQQLSSSGNYVYCVWVDYRVASTSHIFFNYSNDNGLTWQTDKQIDGGGGAAKDGVCIASTGNYVYAAFTDYVNGLGDIYFTYSSNNGASWSVPQRIDLGDLAGSAHSFSPRLACVGNNVYCMWVDQRTTGLNQMYFNYSSNNGQNWFGSSLQISQPLGQNCVMPVKGGLAATGPYVYACWEDDRLNPGSAVNAIYFNRSISSGTTWGVDMQISDSSYYCSMPYLEIENNNVYIGWQDNRLSGMVGIYDMFFDYSTDNGLTWQNPDVGPLDVGAIGINSTAIELAAEGNYVYATWYDTRLWGGMAGDVFFARSINNGASWFPEMQINYGTQPVGLQNNFPVICAGNNYVNVFWPDPRVWGIPQVYTNYSSDNGVTWLTGPDEADVYLVHSYDGGLTWSNPVTVNDDGTTYPQVLPWVLVKNNSMVDVTYYNFRPTPINPQFPGAELRLAVSQTFGSSFMPSFAIQDTVVMPMTDWVGEYNGMAALDTMLYTVFTDNQQSGNSDIYMDITPNPTPSACQGKCGDANNDGSVNVSDAVWVINYVFIGGAEPLPVLACGDANSDGTVNVSDAVWIINYVFIGGAQPGTCSPGSPNWYNGDCCVFTP